MNNALISIVVPVFNKSLYLKGLLESLKNQKYKNCEFILVNDCSTDDSREIIQSYLTNDDRFILIDNDFNIGVSSSRNKGLKAARGFYVGFVDADDVVDSDYVSYMVEKGNNADVLMCGASSIDENGDFIKEIKNPFKQDCTINGLEVWQNFQWILCSAPWNKLFKRELIDRKNVLFENIKGPEDLLFNFKIIDKSTTVFVTNNSLYNYRIVRDSLSRSFGFAEELNDIEVLLEINQYTIDNNHFKYTNILKLVISKYFKILSSKGDNKTFFKKSKQRIKLIRTTIKKQLNCSKISKPEKNAIIKRKLKYLFKNKSKKI